VERVFIGDVQGCSLELEELVDKARRELGPDHSIWIAGDLLNRGPGNLHALEIVRDLVDSGRGEFILGNHEIFTLSVALGLREIRPADSIGDVLGNANAAEWIDWLCARPLAVPGEIDGQPFVMLHAAAAPEWALGDVVEVAGKISERLSASREEARAFLASDASPGALRDELDRLTRCRTVFASGAWSSEEPGPENRPWHAAWREHGHDYGIVYGHWARQGLHVAAGLRGLDTGCVHHGRGRDGFLTAWLPESGLPRSGTAASEGAAAPKDGAAPADGAARRPFDLPDHRFWQIPARQRYYNPEAAAAEHAAIVTSRANHQ